MTFGDRMFWFFTLTFFFGVTVSAIYMHEAGIAAMTGFLGGIGIEKFNGVRK